MRYNVVYLYTVKHTVPADALKLQCCCPVIKMCFTIKDAPIINCKMYTMWCVTLNALLTYTLIYSSNNHYTYYLFHPASMADLKMRDPNELDIKMPKQPLEHGQGMTDVDA